MMRFGLITIIGLLCCTAAFAEQQSNFRDPTAPAVTEAATDGDNAAPVTKVGAILTSKQRRFAVINGKTFKVGDMIDGAKIVDIKLYSVTLSSGGKTRDLPLLNHEVAQPHKGSGNG